MVLLDLLQKTPGIEIIVAHFDHGIREESQQDRKFVQNYAMSHNLFFVYKCVVLGSGASEESARKARYGFLRHSCKKYNALAIIMAHHQDDLLETAVINLLRGTGRNGLTSLRSHKQLLRPMLEFSKIQIINYAKERGLLWREDKTNSDTKYLRNYIRQKILKNIDEPTRKKLQLIIVRHFALNQQIDTELNNLQKKFCTINLVKNFALLPRYLLVMLPTDVSYELLQKTLKDLTGNTVVRNVANQALLFAKTAKNDKKFELGSFWQLRVLDAQIIVEPKVNMIS
jgi:tRNA(Ile)-lysidine synthase